MSTWADAEREAVTNALVMSPMSDHVGTDLAPVSRTARAILDALAPFVEARIRREFDEYADALQANESALGWTHEDYVSDVRDWVRSL